MYYLNKFVGFLSSPLMLILIALSIGFYSVWKGRLRLGLFFVFSSVVCLVLFSMPIMRVLFGIPLEKEFLVDGRVPMVETFPNADAIVVLGGGMGSNLELSPYAEMAAFADRVWQGARLWKAGKAPKIVATGINPKDGNLGLLKDFGVPAENIVFLEARNTEEEAKVVRKQLLRSGKSMGGEVVKNESCANPIKDHSASKSKILLVTSAWHMKRARLMFEKYAPDVEVVCAPADFEYSIMRYRSLGLYDFMPNAEALLKNSIAVHEWIGLIGYNFFR
jgi:uncharacterized SAM-binding protein YcdF (DUF218 family)